MAAAPCKGRAEGAGACPWRPPPAGPAPRSVLAGQGPEGRSPQPPSGAVRRTQSDHVRRGRWPRSVPACDRDARPLSRLRRLERHRGLHTDRPRGTRHERSRPVSGGPGPVRRRAAARRPLRRMDPAPPGTARPAPPEPFGPDYLVGSPVVALACCHVGDHADAEDILAPLRAVAPAEIDLLAPIPYLALQSMFDNSAPTGSTPTGRPCTWVSFPTMPSA